MGGSFDKENTKEILELYLSLKKKPRNRENIRALKSGQKSSRISQYNKKTNEDLEREEAKLLSCLS